MSRWERLDEETGRVIGRDENGDRIDRLPTPHERQYMNRWGYNKHPSKNDEEVARRRERKQ